MLDSATSKQRNVIVRPHGLGVSFIQLDDLKADMLARLAPAVFLILQTSPGNFQAWVAIDRSRGQGFCPPPPQRHRSRRDRERRNARRREPEFQGQVRAGFSARRNRTGAARSKDDSRRTRPARPCRRAGASARRVPCPPAWQAPAAAQMAGLCALPSKARRRTSAGPARRETAARILRGA